MFAEPATTAELIVRATCALTASAIVTLLALRILRPTSIRLQRLAWIFVLLQGCLFI